MPECHPDTVPQNAAPPPSRKVAGSESVRWGAQSGLKNCGRSLMLRGGRVARKIKKSYGESRAEVLRALGGCCVRCGFADFRALQIDHVAGGGVRELRAMRWKPYHAQVLASIAAGEQRYQLLCANCNWIKRAEQNENPKRRQAR